MYILQNIVYFINYLNKFNVFQYLFFIYIYYFENYYNFFLNLIIINSANNNDIFIIN